MASNLEIQWQQEINQLQKEIDSHPFKYMVGFRWNDSSNYTYRLDRENQIKDLKQKLKDEKDRDVLVSHAEQNKTLQDSGVDIANLGEKKHGWDAAVQGMNDFAGVLTKPARDLITTVGQTETPIISRVADTVDNTVNQTGNVLTHGEDAISSVFSSPIVILGGAALAVFVWPKILNKV